jgi:hypothetical protein
MFVDKTNNYPDAKHSMGANKVALLAHGDTLAVKLRDFPDTCRINAIRFYLNKQHEEAHMDFAGWVITHGPKRIEHHDQRKTGKTTTTDLFHVYRKSDREVHIKRTAAEGADEHHAWFRVEIYDKAKNPDRGNKHDYWDLDPEVINTGGGDTRASGIVDQQTGDGNQTLGVDPPVGGAPATP